MAEKLLSPKQIEQEFGFSRADLLRWEQNGVLADIRRTQGGHRRYTRDAIEMAVIDAGAKVDPEVEIDPAIQAAIPYSEFGVTGLRQWGGSVFEERLRELQGREGRVKKREMRLNDPVLGAMFFGISRCLRQAEWRISPASESAIDKKVADFVESCLFEDLSYSWDTQLAFIIEEELEQGFAVNELVWKRRLGENPVGYSVDPATSFYNDGLVGLRKLAPRPAESLASGQEWIFDRHGGIKGIRQEVLYPNEKSKKAGIVEIPISKLAHFRTTPHPANNPEGMSIHRTSYVPWWFKTNIQELEGIGIERDLAGIPVVYLGKNTTKTGANNDYEIAKKLVVNIRNDEQAGIVIPHQKMGNDGAGMLLELLSTSSRRQYNTSTIIMRYDKAMAMSTLSQFLFLGTEGTGSYALASWQGDLFALAIRSFLDGIASVFNRHVITKLIKLNDGAFRGRSGYPKLVPGATGILDLKGFSEFINGMVGATVLTPDEELERHVRQAARLPAATVMLTAEQRAKIREKSPVGGGQSGGGQGGSQEETASDNGNDTK